MKDPNVFFNANPAFQGAIAGRRLPGERFAALPTWLRFGPLNDQLAALQPEAVSPEELAGFLRRLPPPPHDPGDDETGTDDRVVITTID